MTELSDYLANFGQNDNFSVEWFWGDICDEKFIHIWIFDVLFFPHINGFGFWILIQPFSSFSIRSLKDYLMLLHFLLNFMDLSQIVVIQCHFYKDLIVSILFFCLEPSLKSWKAKLVRRYHVLKPIIWLFGFYHYLKNCWKMVLKFFMNL